VAILPDSSRFQIRRRLLGSPTMQILVNRSDLDGIKADLKDSIKSGAKSAAVDLAKQAVDQLYQLDSAARHHGIAPYWTNTKPVESSDGTVSVEVYNSKEDADFQLRSNAPRSRKTYPIKGRDLLNILINGARPHTIASRLAKVPLQFTVEKGVSSSRFVGTALTGRGVEVGRFTNQNRDAVVRANQVNHPGVVGNRFIQLVRDRLEATAASVGLQVQAKVK
jgi:hypothetical protein